MKVQDPRPAISVIVAFSVANGARDVHLGNVRACWRLPFERHWRQLAVCFWNELSDSLPDRIFGIAGHFLGILLRVGAVRCMISLSGLEASAGDTHNHC